MAINGVGDVIALVQLTAQAAKTLHEAKHAPDEIRRFIEETDQYQSCVETAASRLRHHGALLKSHTEVKRNIQSILEQCVDTTIKLRKIASKYQQVVRKKGPAAGKDAAWQQWMEALKTVYHSVEWTTKGDILDKLRAELARNVQMLTWLEGGLMSDRMDQLLVQMNKIQDILTSAISSPSRTPLSSPFGLSPNPPPLAMSPSSQPTSPESAPIAQPQSLAPLQLSEPMLDVNDWYFDHNIDSQLRLPEKFSFPRVTPGDGYRHVKLVSPQEQQNFVDQITAKKDFAEFPVVSVTFVWRKPGSSDEVLIDASDHGKVLLIKNGQAVEDIWTLNEQKTIRFRQRIPTWDDIIPYSISIDKFTAAVEQGEGLTFFTIEGGQRQDHPRITTSWVNYKFTTSNGESFARELERSLPDWWAKSKHPDCERFQEILYGWDLRLLVPVKEICRPHTVGDDDRLSGYENVRVWERGNEMRFMAHLIQEKGKRRKKYLEFDLCQEGLQLESKGKGEKSVLRFTGVNAAIEEFELERRGSTASLNSVSSASSLKRRLSWNQSSPWLDKVDVHFKVQEHRDSLHHLALSCRPVQKAAAGKRKVG
ncbi:hypothetical protein H2200_005371 [Cladophialophora chaetospira]|uniref:Uncharacterized protein n=1 Tax=Cladophialophora chaetospira TaxID=386627 RepID=A0AA38XCI8_9EURO|nr:hypothetical protein H2200_005371 [Cladophialophora chaetospira]